MNVDQTRGYAVGQRYIDGTATLGNASDEPITLVRVEPIYAHAARAAKVYRSTMLLPVKVSPRGREVGAAFQLWPPMFFEEGKCRRFRLVPVEGFVVEPHASSTFALFIHMVRPGRWRIKAERVTYRKGGETYQETLHNGIASHVKRHGRLDVEQSERRCQGRPLSQALHAPLSETGPL